MFNVESLVFTQVFIKRSYMAEQMNQLLQDFTGLET